MWPPRDGWLDSCWVLHRAWAQSQHLRNQQSLTVQYSTRNDMTCLRKVQGVRACLPERVCGQAHLQAVATVQRSLNAAAAVQSGARPWRPPLVPVTPRPARHPARAAQVLQRSASWRLVPGLTHGPHGPPPQMVKGMGAGLHGRCGRPTAARQLSSLCSGAQRASRWLPQLSHSCRRR